MTISGVGVTFYCGVGFADEPKAKAQPIKQKGHAAYHDTTFVQPHDYSYGTSPTSSAGSWSGRNSPTRGSFVPTPTPPPVPVKSEAELTDKERADRSLACRIWGAPWQPYYDALLVACRKETGRE